MIRIRLADVGVDMKQPDLHRSGLSTGSGSTSEEEEVDAFESPLGSAAMRGPAGMGAVAEDSNLEAMLAEMQSAQMQLKRFLELAPWYSQISHFMGMLSAQHGTDVSTGGRRDLFFRCSKFKKDREWCVFIFK